VKTFTKTILILGAAMLLLAACAPADTGPTEDQIATSVHLTTSAMEVEDQQPTTEPTNTPEPEPTEAPPEPTATIEPTAAPTEAAPTQGPSATPLPDDGRIIFNTDTTFTTIKDQIEENSANEYIVNIQKGQMLSVFIESDGKTPALAITEEDGDVLLAASKGFTWYLTNVQKTQDYTVKAVSEDFTSDYILHISTPIDVVFDSGATAKTYEGILLVDDIIDYKAYALKDQYAKITLTSSAGAARLYIYGLETQEEYVGYSDDATTWELTLPASQTYLIKVLAHDADTLYKLTVEFTN